MFCQKQLFGSTARRNKWTNKRESEQILPRLPPAGPYRHRTQPSLEPAWGLENTKFFALVCAAFQLAGNKETRIPSQDKQ